MTLDLAPDLAKTRAQKWHSRQTALKSAIPASKAVVYGSFSRPIDFVWARDLIGLVELHNNANASRTVPWTYVVCCNTLPDDAVYNYELTRII